MIEKVGQCIRCGKDIFCMDGFLNGITLEKGNLLCFPCEEEESDSKDNE